MSVHCYSCIQPGYSSIVIGDIWHRYDRVGTFCIAISFCQEGMRVMHYPGNDRPGPVAQQAGPGCSRLNMPMRLQISLLGFG